MHASVADSVATEVIDCFREGLSDYKFSNARQSERENETVLRATGCTAP